MVALSGGGQEPAGGQPATANTAPVQKGKLSAAVSQDGTLTYRARPDGSPFSAINHARGTYTDLPAVGDKVGCGGVLYRVDEHPVLLLCGTVPAYRGLHVGDAGQDVRQLNRNLRVGGRRFTTETEKALAALQRRRGGRVTGALALGDAVFLPAAVRIAKVTGQLGGAAQPGAQALNATSDTLHVRVNLDPSDQGQVRRGDRAQITLPGNTTVTGKVDGFGRVAEAPAGQGGGAGGATVPTYIDLDDPAQGARARQGPGRGGHRHRRRRERAERSRHRAGRQVRRRVRGRGRARRRATRPGRGPGRPVRHRRRARPGRGRPPRGRPGRRPVAVTAVLELDGVTKVYGEEPPVVALGGVSFSVQGGELVAIVGPSGSGKSTLLHVMGTLERPSGGVVRVGGVDAAQLDDRALSRLRARRIGFVFQQFFLAEHATVRENVADGLLYAGVPAAERYRRADEALERVGLSHRTTFKPTKLSGGERQRVAIARALVGRPAIVLADEPTGNLDSTTGASIMALIRELNADGATIVLITHDGGLADQLPRQIRMLDGRVVSDVGAVA